MTEILLKCPKCETEYRVPASAIPPAGREVECTMCNNSWFARPDEGATGDPDAVPDEVAGADESSGSGVVRHAPSHSRAGDEGRESEVPAALRSDDMPPLRRQLPQNVLDILREEVEFERRARLGEKAGSSVSDVSPAASDDDGEYWPATTITESVPAKKTEPARSETRIVLDQPVQSVPETEVKPVTDDDTSRQPSAAGKVVESSGSAEHVRSGYFSGFGIALIAAAVALVMYLIPPNIAGAGQVADGLSQYQQHVDAGRGWLQQKTSDLLGGQ